MEGLIIIYKALTWMLMIATLLATFVCFVGTLSTLRDFIEMPDLMDFVMTAIGAAVTAICAITFAALVMCYRITF